MKESLSFCVVPVSGSVPALQDLVPEPPRGSPWPKPQGTVVLASWTSHGFLFSNLQLLVQTSLHLFLKAHFQ